MLRFSKTSFEANGKTGKRSEAGERERGYHGGARMQMTEHAAAEREAGAEAVCDETGGLQVVVGNTGAKGANVGCYKAIYFGKCEVAKCAFAHDRATLEATHSKLQELLNNSVYKPVRKFHAMIVDDSAEELMRAHEDFLYLRPLVEGRTSAYVGCSILTGGGEQIEAPKGEVLLDSGASRANYLSKKLFNHSEKFQRSSVSRTHTVIICTGSPQKTEA
jgi:hypothetical protein